MSHLGQRAVACKHWRWMYGMHDGLFGRQVLDVLHNGNLLVHDVEDGEEPIATITPDPNYILPDLTDPATLGCLLALVREAWGCPVAAVRPGCQAGTDVYEAWLGRFGGARMVAWAHTEAEALVAALERAPEGD